MGGTLLAENPLQAEGAESAMVVTTRSPIVPSTSCPLFCTNIILTQFGSQADFFDQQKPALSPPERTNRVRAGTPTSTNQLRASCMTRDAANEATRPVFVWVMTARRREQRRDDHRIVV